MSEQAKRKIVYAEDAPYWRSGHATAPDTKLEQTVDLVRKFGGKVTANGYIEEPNRAAYMLAFEFDGEAFKVIWPVLPRNGRESAKLRETADRAAKLQAATFLFHSVKAKSIDAVVLGVRAAFVGDLLTESGRRVADLATPALAQAIPERLGYGGSSNGK